MYPNPVMGKEISDPWECHDTIGCGLDFVSKKIFFTKNGILVGRSSSSLSITKLHATIGTISFGDKFSINFGNKPFEFDIKHYQMLNHPHATKYPLYSILTETHDRYLAEYFEDSYSQYLDEEMNKITTPVNKEIAYLSDFDEYPNTDRIMKNKIHKYCHQIGQQINGGFAISPEDQNNIAELRRGLAWYWVATKQHYLLLHFVRASMQSIDIDLRYSPSSELPTSPHEDALYVEELAKRRMAKEIGVLLSSNLDITHPFVTSVIRHARSSVLRFEASMTEEQRSIYQDFDQMLQAAEQTDQRMFLALSLSIIIQTREIIKNNRSKKEKKKHYLKREKEMRRLEIEHLVSVGVNLDAMLELAASKDGDIGSLVTSSNGTLIVPNTITTAPTPPMMYSNAELTEEQRLYQKYHYMQRIREALKNEIAILTESIKEDLTEASIDIVVWTYLRLSISIKSNQDLAVSRKCVIETLQAESSRLEKEFIKLEKDIIRLERNIRKQASFSETFFPSSINGNQQDVASSSGHHNIYVDDEDSLSSASSGGGSRSSGGNLIQMNELSIDIAADDLRIPLNPKRHSSVGKPLAISAIAISGFTIVLVIILLCVFLV
eukprot:gene13713-16166_t